MKFIYLLATPLVVGLLSSHAQQLAKTPAQLAIKAAPQQPAKAASAPPAKGNLEQTLSHMDAASARFHSASAHFRTESVTSPIPDADVQTGTTFVTREGSRVRMGAKFEGSQAQTISYDNGAVRIFKPRLNCFNDYSGKNNQAKIESFLTLGFGGSGHDLQKSWQIQDLGPEVLNSDGGKVKVEKLLLTPLDPSVKDLVRTVTIWVDPERDIALKQVRITPNDDTQTVEYSAFKLNAPVNAAAYAINGKPCSVETKH